MTKEQREILVGLRDECRFRAGNVFGVESRAFLGARAAALDAALRELDAADAVRAELPGLIRAVSGPLRDRSAFVRAMRRLCELLPGLAAPAGEPPHAAG